MIRYIAKVVDNKDLEQEGKVQIYIEHLMNGFKVEHYPWARQDREWTSFIPEIGDLVWVYFTDQEFFKKPYYQGKVTLKEYHDHIAFKNEIKNKVGCESEYPDMKYIYLNNKVTLGLSSSSITPEIVIYHPNCYIFIDKQGQCKITSLNGNKIEMLLTGISITDLNQNSILMTGSAVTINNSLVINK
ncbi:MAG TPA: hypothetical protein P5332_10880 [Ignavibacteriales bacterium]|nr:hypothetical protein [Ignavibacteriales bacterium]